MKIKKIINKYIYLIIPMMLLILNVVILKVFDGGYAKLSGNMNMFYLIMLILLITPSVCLILESIGLIKAVREFRKINENESYNVIRGGIRYISFFGGALLLTALWFCAMIYITVQYFR